MQNHPDQPAQESSRRKSLPVLPHSGKVDELRQQAAEVPAIHQPDDPSRDPNHAPAPQGAPLDGATVSHVNRVEAEGREPTGLEAKVVGALRSVFDPEIPVNIYELGLIYTIDIKPDNVVHVRMTLTAPGCPVAGTLPPEVEMRIEAIPEVTSATVELVWDPPWAMPMMSEVARLELGMF
jgi:FeS assembly SUF system protein